MYTKKQNLLNTISLLLLSSITSVATAADTYTMPGVTGGNFEFWASDGSNDGASDHTDVIASLDFTAGTGSLRTNTTFNGATWVADVAQMFFYDGSVGGAFQTFTYTFTSRNYIDGDFNVFPCRLSGALNGCADEIAAGYTQFGPDTVQSYKFNLSEGEFALGLFFDWTVNEDIPVLGAYRVTGIDASGNITTTSIDTGDGADDGALGGVLGDGFLDGDGVPGTKMLTAPFADQSPVFSGVFNLATADSPITAQSAVTTAEGASVTLTNSDFTFNTNSFPSRLYTTGNKVLTAKTGTGYTVSSTATIDPDTDRDTAITVPVGLTISSNLSATFDATVGITASNDDAPAISCSYQTTATVNTAYSQTPTSSDPDTGDTLVFSFTSDADVIAPTLPANTLPTGMSFNAATGAITGTPTVQNEQAANLVVTVTDTLSGGLTASCPAFILSVRGPNTNPTMTSGTPTDVVNEDAGYNFDVNCTDADPSDSISSYTLSGNKPSWMSIGATGLITGTPDNSFVGTVTGIIATCNDTAGGSASVTFPVTVINTNDAPTIAAGTCTATAIEARGSYSCSPTADDVDIGDVLTFSATGLPASGNLAIDASTGAITGTTADADAGVHNIVISVRDAGGPVTTSLASFALTVNAFNEPPVTTGALLKTPEDTVLNGSLSSLASDPESCGCLTYTKDPVNTATAFGSVVISANGDFVYTPNTGYNGTDSFNYIATDTDKPSSVATVQILVGEVTGETYTSSNFTMFDAGGANANGGTNDVIASWDGLYNTDESDSDFSHMTLSSITPYFGKLWTAHHIRVYGPGTYTFDTTCTITQLENGEGGPGQLCNGALGAGQTNQTITMTVAAGQVGAHILFDWDVTLNIDVLNVWDVNSEFDISANPGTGVLYNAAGFGPYPWSGAPAADTVWRLASSDNDGDGIPGIPMEDGAFIGFNANFNLDIISTGSNFTMFDAGGANANGGTNDVVASWDGLFNADESDADFTHMSLSSITPYFGKLWTAHHVRVFGPGTYTFDTTCTVAQLENGEGGPGALCNGPLGAGQSEQFVTMTVGAGQIGAHILFDWDVTLNIDVLNVWDINSEFDISTNPGTGVLYNGAGFGPYPWSGAPAANTSWRLASTDGDADGIPGIAMEDGAFIGFNANFNLFVGSGAVCVPTDANNHCGTKEVNIPVEKPTFSGSAFSLLALYLTWLFIRFNSRRK